MQGKRDTEGKTKVRRVSLMEEPDLHIVVEKNEDARLQARIKQAGANVHAIGVAKEDAATTSSFGAIHAIPVDLGYACSIHKGQGLTIFAVYALLEGLFSHGQMYLQTSRTPLENNFKCVVVPPRDIFNQVLEAVRLEEETIRSALTWMSNHTYSELLQDLPGALTNDTPDRTPQDTIRRKWAQCVDAGQETEGTPNQRATQIRRHLEKELGT